MSNLNKKLLSPVAGEIKTIFRPLRGLIDFATLYAGRCPALKYYAPEGAGRIQSGLDYFSQH
jgi:hypothetical protein